MNNTDALIFGARGCVYETGTTAVTGVFYAITMLSDTVFSALTNRDATGDSLAGATIKAGVTILGHFTAFTLTSGAVCAYNK